MQPELATMDMMETKQFIPPWVAVLLFLIPLFSSMVRGAKWGVVGAGCGVLLIPCSAQLSAGAKTGL